MTFYHWLALAFFVMVPEIVYHLVLLFDDYDNQDDPFDDISGGNI